MSKTNNFFEESQSEEETENDFSSTEQVDLIVENEPESKPTEKKKRISNYTFTQKRQENLAKARRVKAELKLEAQKLREEKKAREKFMEEQKIIKNLKDEKKKIKKEIKKKVERGRPLRKIIYDESETEIEETDFSHTELDTTEVDTSPDIQRRKKYTRKTAKVDIVKPKLRRQEKVYREPKEKVFREAPNSISELLKMYQ